MFSRRAWLLAVLPVALAVGCKADIEHGLDERQANRSVVLLDEAGIAADKTEEDRGTFVLAVPRADAARAVSVLAAHDLPRPAQKGIAETFASGSLLPSPIEEQARLLAATAAELERTLEGLPGVLSARVHLAAPSPGALPGLPTDPDAKRRTASVLIKADRPLPIGDADVRLMVAGAVAELGAADVTVVVARVSAPSATSELVQLGPLRVSRESRLYGLIILVAGLGIILGLAVMLAVVVRRRWIVGQSRNTNG